MGREERRGLAMSRLAKPTLVALLALSAFPSAQEQAERRIQLDGRPIAAHLTADDRRIVFETINDRPLRIQLESSVAARLLPHNSDVIAVIRVESVLPRLVTRTAGRTSLAQPDAATLIFSVIRGRVEQSLKGPFQKGDVLQLVEEGGTARIRGVEVRYIVPWQREIVSGKRYLVFAILNDEDEFISNVAYQEPSPGNLLISSYVARPEFNEPDDAFEQLSLEQAVAQVVSELQ